MVLSTINIANRGFASSQYVHNVGAFALGLGRAISEVVVGGVESCSEGRGMAWDTVVGSSSAERIAPL